MPIFTVVGLQIRPNGDKSDQTGGRCRHVWVFVADRGDCHGKIRVRRNYFLNTSNQMVKPSSTGNLKEMRAYFNILAAASGEPPVRVLISGFDDESTGISTVRGDASTRTGAVYDLSGRRVQNPQHGLYIVNGKKVVIK